MAIDYSLADKPQESRNIQHYLLLFIGIICCSSSVIFIKQSDIHPILLASYRTLLACLLLLPLAIKSLPRQFYATYFKASITPGVLLASHFISWIYGARITLAINSSLIVNMTALASPFLLFIIAKEKVTKNEILGTIIAFVGLLILGVHDFDLDKNYFMGDLICFGSMLLFAAYLIYAKKYKNLTNTLAYVTCVYGVCGLCCLIIAIILQIPLLQQLDSNNTMQIIYLAVITTILGHNLLNVAMKNIRGQVVSILMQGQFIFAGIMAYYFLDEIPNHVFYIAMLFLILGSYTAIKKPQTHNHNL